MMKRRFAFISQNEITNDQSILAAAQNIELVHVGDCDPYSVKLEDFDDPEAPFDGAVVTHLVAAKRLHAEGLSIGVFENQMRANEGKKPPFKVVSVKALHIFE